MRPRGRMAGRPRPGEYFAMTDPSLVPTEIKMHRKSRILELVYADGQRYDLAAEYLRVYSPSAEVQVHGPGQAVLIVGKEGRQYLVKDPLGSGQRLDLLSRLAPRILSLRIVRPASP